MKITVVILFAALGAFLSRWHGGGFGGGSKVLKNIIWALPFGCASFYITAQNAGVKIGVIFGLSAFLLCLIGKATGHGGGMDLAHSLEEPGAGRRPEKLEYLILGLHGKMPQYWYDALLLMISGFAAVSGAVFVFCYVNFWFGVIIALGGLSKALAYIIGWSLVDEDILDMDLKDFDEATEIGEFLTGFFAYGGLASAVVLL